MRKIVVNLVCCVCIMAGCTLPFSSSVKDTQTLTPDPNSMLVSNDNAAVTRTPFQPIPPTATPRITSTPTESALTSTPPFASAVRLGLPRPEGQVNILILGSDYRPNQGYRTDVIMILSINPEKGTASLTSFPRDLYVNLPGVGMNRINSAQPYGGFTLSAATMKDNFDVTVDYYIMTTFNGFKSIVDTLGGINVNAAVNLSDTCDLPQAVNKYCSVPAGVNIMNGATALWYVRSRHSGSDFDRTRRAQEVMSALFHKAMSLDALNRGSELYALFITSVETNLDATTVIKLLPFAATIVANPTIVKRYSIGADNVTNYVVPGNGSMVLLPDPVSIKEIIRHAFYQ